MGPVEKAIWYIESHYEQAVSLDDVARVAGVSRFYLSRAFADVTGLPLTRYLRYRRLSQAARALASGKNDILDLALSLGYSSHEAFSRAFKDLFGVTPESVRRQGDVENLPLLPAQKTGLGLAVNLPEPEITQSDELLLAGLSKSYSAAENAEIPGQWQEFSPRFRQLGQVSGNETFGVYSHAHDGSNYSYLCAFQVPDFNSVSDDLTRLRIQPQTYAVFLHRAHISQVRSTHAAIWSQGLRRLGRQAIDAPFFERYSSSFDSETGEGGLEIWVPIR